MFECSQKIACRKFLRLSDLLYSFQSQSKHKQGQSQNVVLRFLQIVLVLQFRLLTHWVLYALRVFHRCFFLCVCKSPISHYALK